MTRRWRVRAATRPEPERRSIPLASIGKTLRLWPERSPLLFATPLTLENHANPHYYGADGNIEREMRCMHLFVIPKLMRPHNSLQLRIKMREEV